MGEGVASKAISGEPSGVWGDPSRQSARRGEVLRSSRPQGSTHFNYHVRPLREDVGLDGNAAGVDKSTAVLFMVKGSWGKTSRP